VINAIDRRHTIQYLRGDQAEALLPLPADRHAFDLAAVGHDPARELVGAAAGGSVPPAVRLPSRAGGMRAVQTPWRPRHQARRQSSWVILSRHQPLQHLSHNYLRHVAHPRSKCRMGR